MKTKEAYYTEWALGAYLFMSMMEYMYLRRVTMQ